MQQLSPPAGLRITVMNSAMDRVGLPAYGPDLIGQNGGWQQLHETLQGLPAPLRAVWLQAATMPASGEAILNADRRRISIETKRVLEGIPGLQFRQGLVTDLRVLEDAPGFEHVSDGGFDRSTSGTEGSGTHAVAAGRGGDDIRGGARGRRGGRGGGTQSWELAVQAAPTGRREAATASRRLKDCVLHSKR